MKLIDMRGQTFHRLTVIDRDESGRWVCQCECGNTNLVQRYNLVSGKTKSCGCWKRERSTTHGMSDTPIYGIWGRMIQRCYNPNLPHYARYGGRGIKVCEQWHVFERFLRDVGEPPPNPADWDGRKAYWSIDRIDVDGDYEPGNVRWATPSEQTKNQRRYKTPPPPCSEDDCDRPHRAKGLCASHYNLRRSKR